MRTDRVSHDREMCYYHLRNQVAGAADYFPFGDIEKEELLRLAVEVSRFYSLEMLSFVCMGGHWHAVCAASAEQPSREEVIANWRAFKGETTGEPDWDDESTVARLGARMRDVSSYVKDFQQRFTCWYNRVRRKGRRGGLWADRFKSVVLERSTALWDCLVYVEMNPVRAGLVESPGDYWFSTWGRLVGGGKHPFAANLARHLRPCLGKAAGRWSDKRVMAELVASMDRIATANGDDERLAPDTHARFVVTPHRRVRHWSDGAVIGSEQFVREVAAAHFGGERAEGKRLAKGVRPDSAAPPLFSYRQPGPRP